MSAVSSIQFCIAGSYALEIDQGAGARGQLSLFDQHVGDIVLNGKPRAAARADQRIALCAAGGPFPGDKPGATATPCSPWSRSFIAMNLIPNQFDCPRACRHDRGRGIAPAPYYAVNVPPIEVCSTAFGASNDHGTIGVAGASLFRWTASPEIIVSETPMKGACCFRPVRGRMWRSLTAMDHP